MTCQARPARASSGARQARAPRHGSTCQLSMAVYTGFNPISCCYEERAQGHRCDFKWGLSWWHAKRAQRAPRQARARRARLVTALHVNCLWLYIPDLIQFLAVMGSAHKAPAVISNGAFHDAMTSARPARARRAACLEKLYRLIWDTRTRAAWHCIHIMSAVYGCIPDFLLSWSARGQRVCIVTSPLAPNAHMFFIYMYIYIISII